MGEPDVVLTATLDSRGVDRALKHIERRFDQMAKSGNKRMRELGIATGKMAAGFKESEERLEGLLNAFNEDLKDTDQGDTKAIQRIEGDIKKTKAEFVALRASVVQSARAVDILIRRLRDIEDIQIKVGVKIPRNELRGLINQEISKIRGDILEQRLRVIMRKAKGVVKEDANAMLKDLQALMNDPTISGKELGQQIDLITRKLRQMGQTARDAQEVGGERRVESRQARGQTVAREEARALSAQLKRIGDSDLGKISAQAKIMREDLEKAMKDPQASAEQLEQDIKKISTELSNVIKQSQAAQQLRIKDVQTGRFTTGGRREDVRRKQAELLAGSGVGRELNQQINRLLNSAQEDVKQAASNMQKDIAKIFDGPLEGEALLAEIKKLKKVADDLGEIKPVNVVEEEEINAVRRLNDSMRKLDRVSAEASENITDAGQKRVQEEQKIAQAAADRANGGAKAAKKEQAAINKSIMAIRTIGKEFKKAAVDAEDVAEAVEEIADAVEDIDPIDKKIQGKEGMKAFNLIMKDTSALVRSSDKDVRQLGKDLQRAGREAKDSMDKGRKSTADFRKEMERLRGLVNRTADAFDEEIPSGANKSTVSMWKLGNAMDRIGVRGVGGAVRIADAFRGISPAAIGGVLAVAAITAGVIKLVEALGRLVQKSAEAFAGFIEGASESAKAVEVTDRQLGAFLRAPELGVGYRKLLQSISFDVGLDLTRNFSKVIVPLARDLDEVEKAAKIAGTLANAFQETEEAISNAIKQASGGHFRPLIQRFGLTEFEIDRIQRYQEEFGEFTGVLIGLGEALEFRGLSIDTLSGTLQLLTGQLAVLKEQILITVGEPVNDAFARQLESLFNLVDDRKDSILGFFENLGDTVASVIDTVGDILEDLFSNISDQDIRELEVSVQGVGGSIERLLQSVSILLQTDEGSIADYMIAATDATASLILKLDELVNTLGFIRDLPVFDTNTILKEGGDVATLGDTIGFVASNLERGITGPVRAAETVGVLLGAISPDVDIDEAAIWKELLSELVPILFTLGIVTDEATAKRKALAEAEEEGNKVTEDSVAATKELINARQEIVAQLQDLEQLQLKALEAQEKITEAEEKLAADRLMREEEIRTRFARQEIDLETQRSHQREDLFARHVERLLQLTESLNFDRIQAGVQFDRKEEDIRTKHQDKLTDIDRTEADKKIDIEKKFRERLADIRRRFDLDAEEAIRRNDAVGLLRIRRRMRAELETARINRDRQEDEAKDSSEDRRNEAQIWLERAIRDSSEAEKRKLEDIVTADAERRRQLIDQYSFEFAQIDTQYERRRAAIDTNEDRAIEDMRANFKAREEALAMSLEEEFDLVKEWKDKETEYMALKLREQAALLAKQRAIWVREMRIMRTLIGNASVFDPGNLTGVPSSFGTGPPGGVSDRFGRRGDLVVENGVVGYRQHGGFVTSGNIYGVNERGAEAFYATRAGIIAPRDSFIGSPFGVGSASNIDNSRHVNADIYASDPTQMNPIQRTIMRQIVTEELLNYGV